MGWLIFFHINKIRNWLISYMELLGTLWDENSVWLENMDGVIWFGLKFSQIDLGNNSVLPFKFDDLWKN